MFLLSFLDTIWCGENKGLQVNIIWEICENTKIGGEYL